MFAYVLNLLFPVNCGSCGGKVEVSSSLGVCRQCINNLEISNSDACGYCGRPIDNVVGFCSSCIDGSSNIDKIYTSCYYRNNIKNLIINFKFRNRKYLGRLLAELLIDVYKKRFTDEVDLIVPLPLSPSRTRERGYNQAEILCRYFSKKTGIKMSKKMLWRTKNTLAQSSLSRRQRFRNMEKAFKASNKAEGLRILLIDDVATTGATLQNAASALRKAGASEVYGLVVAHGK